MRASRLALVNYLSPVFAVALGTLLFHEQLTLRVIAGAALVIVGVAVTTSSR
jgi:drug/metabolite transporter (DMT)-like permease